MATPLSISQRGAASGSKQPEDLLLDLNKRLDRGEGCSADKFDIPEDGNELPVEMTAQELKGHPRRRVLRVKS